MSLRPILEKRAAQPTLEGRRASAPRFWVSGPASDPFLLFDDFRSNHPELYQQGHGTPIAASRRSPMCWKALSNMAQPQQHRHPGCRRCAVDDRRIRHPASGDARRLPRARCTAPGGTCPAARRCAPRYQDVQGKDIPEVIDDDGTVKVIVGEFWGKRGPVDGIAADPQYLDIYVPAGVKKTFKIDTYRRAFAYVFNGQAAFPMPRVPQACCWKRRSQAKGTSATCPATARWCALAPATRSPCRRAPRACASC